MRNLSQHLLLYTTIHCFAAYICSPCFSDFEHCHPYILHHSSFYSACKLAAVYIFVLYIGCFSDEFKCDNNKCVTEEYRCDNINNCGDNSDEEECGKLFTYMPN